MAGETCGMFICKKCGWMNVLFGALILVAALWSGAPTWFNPWTFIGLFVLIWGFMSTSGKQH